MSDEITAVMDVLEGIIADLNFGNITRDNTVSEIEEAISLLKQFNE